ncbi:MAG TPA: ATP-binding protein [Candidatus Accumulibacter phosphatis]|nr:ATP-binding protein [Candidatus Accumulibacter phosphatis]HRQ96935.1 ATP-binding protein [Candidatus Accumulibacter phosphatis]
MKLRLFPASLAARTVLLVIAVIAVAEIATFSLLAHFRRGAHVNQTVHLLAGQVRLLQVVLPALDADARAALGAADADGLQLRADGAGVPRHEPRFPFARRLADELAQRLAEPVLIRHGGPGQRSGLWIGFIAAGERWWLVLPPPRFEPQELPRDLWLFLAATLAAVLLIAGLFVRNIVGPLARLGEAVTATGDGTARTVTPQGPLEVRRLAERHNAMLGQLASAAAERREMIAGLTHDLRAPLTRLRLRLELLASDSERCGLARDVDDMERIVGQCLAFLRSEGGEAASAPICLATLLREEIGHQRELGRPVALSVSDSAENCPVPISAGNLRRLFDNLIDNALQHGSPPVEVALAKDTDGAAILSVRDHGPGIADADRERALEPFAQLEPARATDGSCGLGLAIVRRIAAGCGGELRLEEAPGGGLLVVVRLPTA